MARQAPTRIGRRPKFDSLPGTRQLRTAVTDSKKSQVTLGVELGVSQQALSRWIAGHARPSETWRKVLFELFRIPVDAWQTAAEREAIARATAMRRAG